jgi:peptidoglycan/LPS O-acetylase OafA/YrhL
VVNANLWTLPSEFDCYLITAVLMLTGLLYRRGLFTVIFLLLSAIFAVLNLTTDFALSPGILPPFAITYYFFMGVLAYHWRDRVPAHWLLFLICGVASYALLMSQRTVFIAPALITYCTVFSGLVAIPKLPLISKGDYSYGIYLYGFPIAQALVAIAPGIFIGHRYILLAVATVVTCSFAAFSWHLIERRALGAKRHLPERFFPRPAKVPRQSPEGRSDEANSAATAPA